MTATTLTVSPAKGIYDLLVAAAVGDGGWTLQYGKLSADPDQQLAVLNSSGPSGEPSLAMDYPGVQLLCRGKAGTGAHEATYLKMAQAKAALVGIPDGGATYPALDSVTLRGDIVPLGEDDSGRPIFSLNLQLMVSYATNGYRV